MDKSKRKKITSIRFDPELLREAQHYAIDHDLTMQDMVEKALRLLMKQEGK